MFQIIFCCDPLDPRQPDSVFSAEANAAEINHVAYGLINFEALVYEQDLQAAVKRIAPQENERLALYRGWMLKPEQYSQVYTALLERGWRLINDPDQYRHTHHLPESYKVIQDHTARTVWLETGSEVSMDSVMELLRIFGNKPVIVRDYAKSQKHYWLEACYIPSAADRDAVARVVHRFIELQDDDLSRGLVFREFLDLEPLAIHPKSGLRLSKEYRIFWLDGQPLFSVPYWQEGEYDDSPPPIEDFQQVAQAVASRFFTMDIAKQVNGDWIIIELGDGQVSGLPERTDPAVFYQKLAAKL